MIVLLKSCTLSVMECMALDTLSTRLKMLKFGMSIAGNREARKSGQEKLAGASSPVSWKSPHSSMYSDWLNKVAIGPMSNRVGKLSKISNKSCVRIEDNEDNGV